MMRRYDRTWPTAVLAIASGALLGAWATTLVSEPEPAERPERTQAFEPSFAIERSRSEAESERAAPPRLARGLLEMGNDEVLAMLRYDDQAELRRLAASLVGANPSIGEGPAALMVAAAGDVDASVRAAATQSLGRLHYVGAVPVISVAASDAEVEVRRAAMEALRQIRDISGQPALIAALEGDADDEVRSLAARALGDVAQAEGRRALDAALRRERSDDVRRTIRLAIVEHELRSR
jgi:HEAT repeat protein